MTKKELKQFTLFLERAGAQLLKTTNEWEILRFKANSQTGVVYQNKKGVCSFVFEAQTAWIAFCEGLPYSGATVVNRPRRTVLLRTLIARDGNNCFYCGEEIVTGKETLEHLFSINQGGTNHVSNLVLAHESCNQKAASLPVIKKVLLREEMMRDKG